MQENPGGKQGNGRFMVKELEPGMGKRGGGVLLHLTSLPSPYGIGDLGPEAYRFVDFLAAAKQRYWQVLPLNPTDPIHNDSPYSSVSAFAGNPILISPDLLFQEHLLLPGDLEPLPDLSPVRVDYPRVHQLKELLLDKAYRRFCEGGDRGDFAAFCEQEASWLNDFALFRILKRERSGEVWGAWPPSLRDRSPEDLHKAERESADRGIREKFDQYIFFRQWRSLREYARQKGIQLIGDVPIYVDYDSADVWVHPGLFKLNDQKRPSVVAGVPPDYFSNTGQRWGNPIYRWEAMKEDGYAWWMKRIAHNLSLLDWVRIDHFRGLVAFWEVPAEEETAINGRWVEARAMDFFRKMRAQFPHLPVIAEDLGIITPDVHEVMEAFGFPGMKVLLFAFGPDMPMNPYIPHNLPRNCVAYTGTHDNNTIRGWFEKEASPDERQRLARYLGREIASQELPREMIRLLLRSAAHTVILPLQDLLGLGGEAQMNRPATKQGNWEWRLLPGMLTHELAADLGEMAEVYGRAE